MMPAFVIGTMLGAVLGAAGAWVLGRGRVRAAAAERVGAGAGPHLLPDPALDWLLRAHHALGIWVTELDPREEGPRAERIVDADRLAVAQIVAVDRRLERARDEEASGAERMEAGTLVFRAGAGIAVGLLLPEGHASEALGRAEDDLQRLLDGVRRRPQVVALAQARSDETALESVGSVALRLAYQLERVAEGGAVVAMATAGGVRVVGVSGRADRRALEVVLSDDAALAQVARGARGAGMFPDDPLGGVIADRRQRAAPVYLVPVQLGELVAGAAAIWMPGGLEPAGQVLAEVTEAARAAAPRLARALESEGLKQIAIADPLTGLANRRTMESVLGRHGTQGGSLIFADLDKFKLLNDTLGHAAGDAALVHFARILRELIRQGDTAARMGGEEFAVWLPEAPLEVGLRIAERIRVKLGSTAWDWQGRGWPLSASFGVASVPETSRRLENLPAQADAAMYVAKKSGRDRVEAAARLIG